MRTQQQHTGQLQRKPPVTLCEIRIMPSFGETDSRCGLSRLDAQNEPLSPLSHLVYVGHKDVVASLVILSQAMFETVVHRWMAERCAVNDREDRVISITTKRA